MRSPPAIAGQHNSGRSPTGRLSHGCRRGSAGRARTRTRRDNAPRRSAPARRRASAPPRRRPARRRSVVRCQVVVRRRPPPPRRRTAAAAAPSASAATFRFPSGSWESLAGASRTSITQTYGRAHVGARVRAHRAGRRRRYSSVFSTCLVSNSSSTSPTLTSWIALEHDAALEALLDLLHVVLEAAQRADPAGPDDGAVADQAHLGAAGDLAVGDRAAGDRADRARP